MSEFNKKKFSNLTFVPFLFLLCAQLITAPTYQNHAAPEVEITYTGNEGFLIAAEGKKILIDAFHSGHLIRRRQHLIGRTSSNATCPPASPNHR